MPRLLPILLLVIILSVIAASQAPTPSEPPAAVIFTLDFPASQPEHYSIRIQSDGASHYNSSGRLSADSEDTDTFDFDFPTLPVTREKVFALAAKAGYFRKDVDSHHKNLAFTG